jgi:polyhydroxyalkanoate synthesis repressor PhaR
MVKFEDPIVIKKYANRRLYNTGTGNYATLEDIIGIIKAGDDFIVCDAKTGEDVTRSALTQIILEQENKGAQHLLPIKFLRQLTRFYGDIMQALVPCYLEISIDSLTREQERLRQHMSLAFSADSFAPLEDLARRNMEMFERAFVMIVPFARREAQTAEAGKPESSGIEIDELKRQLDDVLKRLDRLSETKG